MVRRAVLCLFLAVPLFAEKMPPAFRAESYHYREPHHIAVQSTALANPAIVLDAPAATLSGGGDPPQVGVVRTLPQPYEVGVGQTFSSAQRATPATLAFRSAGAARVRLHLANVHLAGELTVYGRDGMATTFGSDENDQWTPSVDGDTIAITFGASDRFDVVAVGHVYAAEQPASTSCYVDVACYNFADRDVLSRAVATMTFAKSSGLFACTGGLINGNDGDRLFLTANHCISTQSEASSLELTWDFRSSSCGSSTTLATSKTHGATLLATSATSDVTLLRLPSLPANRVLLGWTTTAPPAGTTLFRISHPAALLGGVNRQLYSTTVVNSTAGACSSRPRPSYLYSSTSIGGTGGGSSGSPVIIEGGYIVGQLFGACGPDPENECSVLSSTVDGAFKQSYSVLSSFVGPGDNSSTCTPSSANLCLLGNRFKVILVVNDPRVSGAGYANSTTQGDWGYFDVPAATSTNDKPVIFVKVIDGRPVNNRFWVFYGGLTDLQYSFTVTDTQTGASKTYSKASGTYDGKADTEAFPGN